MKLSCGKLGGKMYGLDKNYYVYRYLDKNGTPIYVGLTSRPLAKRVREHKVEELNKETAKIQYIILPNEAQMHQYEWYYIDYFKPKYNVRDVHNGEPSINNKYDCKWIDYPKNGDIRQIEQIVAILNQTVFKERPVDCHITITQHRRKMTGVCSERLFNEFGKIKRELIIHETDFFTNSKRMLIDIIAQMAQFVAAEDGIKASRAGNYYSRRINRYFEKYGLYTKYDIHKYGYEPVNCKKEISDLFSQYEFGSEDIEVYTKEINKSNVRGKTSTRKYWCPCCNNCFRATKKINVMCGDCGVNYITDWK